MQSDDRSSRVEQILSRPIGAFRSVLAKTVEDVRSILSAHGATGSENGGDKGEDLGNFARGRIDYDQFSSLFSPKESMDASSRQMLEAAFNLLSELVDHKEGLTHVQVPSGGSLRNSVADGLAEIGRAFGAARVAALSRANRFDQALHESYLERYPFALWSAKERQVSPPLIVEVDGQDLLAEGLIEFLDGNQKFVLVVRGKSPPAPLARLIAPGTFVVQTTDPSNLAQFAAFNGPGIAAVVPSSAALFVHDPAGGAEPWHRLSVEFMPHEDECKRLGGLSVPWQQASLEHVKTLAITPPTAVASAPAANDDSMKVAAPSKEVERLADWLLKRTDLQGL